MGVIETWFGATVSKLGSSCPSSEDSELESEIAMGFGSRGGGVLPFRGQRSSDIASCKGNRLSKQRAAQPPFFGQRIGFFIALNSYVRRHLTVIHSIPLPGEFGTPGTWSQMIHYRPPVPARHPYIEGA